MVEDARKLAEITCASELTVGMESFTNKCSTQTDLLCSDLHEAARVHDTRFLFLFDVQKVGKYE